MSEKRALDVLLLFLGQWQDSREERAHVYRVLMGLVACCRRSDDYEANPDPRRPLGAITEHCSVGFVWEGQEWSIDGLTELLLGCETFHIAEREYTDRLADSDMPSSASATRPEIHIEHTYLRTMAQVPTTRVDHLVELIFWLSIDADTRAQRVCFKAGHLLDDIGLGSPPQVKIMAIRTHLRRLLADYASGTLNHAELRRALWGVYATGGLPPPTHIASSSAGPLLDAAKSAYTADTVTTAHRLLWLCLDG